MKKVLSSVILASSLFLVAGAAFAAEPATDPATAQPVAVMATGTDANSQTMMPTSASAPVPSGMPNMPNQDWGNSRPMMRDGNATYGNPGMMGGTQGFNMVVQRPRGAMGIAGMVVGGITLLMVWAIMVLTIIALCKWIKKQSK